ncbi:MAG: UDP-3-O-(3-hydroxymyristoyl)glucosamine N-acyltransferase [Betaproteobacteria bacterium]|nr:UDP-3-O-(3-hydroxymyristoyl)glucosamine N-acyltransferase [Betaproteobacteria bacterium]
MDVALRLGDIVDQLGGTLHGDPGLIVQGLSPLDTAQAQHLSFITSAKFKSQLLSTRAGVVVMSEDLFQQYPPECAVIVVDQPYVYFALLTQLWKQRTVAPAESGIHPSAVVHPEALVHPSASVGPLCVVEQGAQIGFNTVLHSRVTVGARCVVGARCIVHSGAVIGADGFGFAPTGAKWEKIEQLGAVKIGNDVEIGANTCIDRGALQDTVIEDGVKLDNLIQIGHNTRIGQHTAMAGCVGVAGSADIGAHCTIGGGAVVLGHLKLVDGVHISAASVVTRSLLKPGHYSGVFPIDDNAAWEKNAVTLKQLYQLRDRIRKLEQHLSENSD